MRQNVPVTNKEKDFSKDWEIISSTDLKGCFTYANEQFLQLSGFTWDELDRKNHNIIRHPDVPPAVFANLWDDLKAGKPWMGIIKNRCKDGDHYWVDAFVTPIFEGKEVSGFESVRVHSTPEQVERATSIYKEFSNGKPNRLKQFWRKIPLVKRLGLKCSAVFVVLAWYLLSIGSSSTVLILGGIGTALLAVWALLYQGTKHLRRLSRESRGILDNDLVTLLYTGDCDEVSQLYAASLFQSAKLRTALGRIRESARDLTEEVNLSVEATTESCAFMQGQLRETEQAAAAIEEMSASVKEVAESASGASESAAQADQQTYKGKEVVSGAIVAIDKLAQEVGQVGDVIQDLKSNCDEIGNVLSVIQEIADQTNLLALNAAIEAARAGEQGRGFAVVADEVRTLADRTRASTRDIEEMIKKVQSSTQQAVATVHRGTQQAATSVEQGLHVNNELDTIGYSVANVNEMMAMIASATKQQVEVSGELAEKVERINSLSLEASNRAMGVTESSQRVAEYAENLMSMSLRFKS